MGSRAVHEDDVRVIINGVDDPVPVREAHGEETGKVADQSLFAARVRRDGFSQNLLQLLLELGRELAEVLYRFPSSG
jgi:hypothetical protein